MPPHKPRKVKRLTKRQQKMAEQYIPSVAWFLGRFGKQAWLERLVRLHGREEVEAEAYYWLCRAARGHIEDKGKFITYAATTLMRMLPRMRSLNAATNWNGGGRLSEDGYEIERGDDWIGALVDDRAVKPGLDEDERELVRQTIDLLPPKLSSVARGIFLEGKTCLEIGKGSGFTRQMADQYKQQALHMLGLLLDWSEGRVTLRQRKEASPEDAARMAAGKMAEVASHCLSLRHLLAWTGLSLKSINAGLKYNGWFEPSRKYEGVWRLTEKGIKEWGNP